MAAFRSPVLPSSSKSVAKSDLNPGVRLSTLPGSLESVSALSFTTGIRNNLASHSMHSLACPGLVRSLCFFTALLTSVAVTVAASPCRYVLEQAAHTPGGPQGKVWG